MFHVIFRISEQQLNTSNKQYATNGSLVGVLFLSRKKFHAKQFVVLRSSMRLAPGSYRLAAGAELKGGRASRQQDEI